MSDPCVQTLLDEDKAGRPSLSVPAPRKVLMIDDERFQFRLVQAHFKQFRAEQFALDWAPTYEEGLEKLMAGGYAACLLDYRLGPCDGLELVQEALGRGCRTPVVFLTSESNEAVDISAMNAGASDYLLKNEITAKMLERSIRYAMKLSETMEALRQLATHDELTGLINRREFDRLLHEELERSQRFGHPVALVLADIDHFKEINDAHGHPVGDRVLRQVAESLRGGLRAVDRLARFGGEEFAIILMEADPASALETARRLCATVADGPLQAGGGPPATISAGVAAVPKDARTGDGLILAADQALYAAKKAGRNQAVAAG